MVQDDALGRSVSEYAKGENGVQNEGDCVIGRQGNGVQMFLECSSCERRVAVSTEDFGDTWWSCPPQQDHFPETCPRCPNYETYIEQAEIALIEVFYDWGYKQWSENGENGWRIKIEVGTGGGADS